MCFTFFAGAVIIKHRFWTTETVKNIQLLQYTGWLKKNCFRLNIEIKYAYTNRPNCCLSITKTIVRLTYQLDMYINKVLKELGGGRTFWMTIVHVYDGSLLLKIFWLLWYLAAWIDIWCAFCLKKNLRNV